MSADDDLARLVEQMAGAKTECDRLDQSLAIFEANLVIEADRVARILREAKIAEVRLAEMTEGLASLMHMVASLRTALNMIDQTFDILTPPQKKRKA